MPVNNNTGDFFMKKVLFTGARSGISNATLERVKNDYYIYLTVHTEKQLEKVKEKYKNYSNIECFKLDVTNNKDKEKLKKLDIDILVSIAAIGEGGSISEIDMDRVRNNFEVNVFSNFEIVQIVLKNMIKKDSGKIIMMSSLASILPIPFLGSYCSTKASISMLTTTLKKEIKLISKNIKICLIEPGIYDTGFNQVMLDNKYKWMDLDSYFKEQIKFIRKKENLFFNLLEKKNLNSITSKIENAIRKDNPRFIYRAPIIQSIGTKLYQIFINN